jgi:large subunit ribosomal protein L23
MRTNDILIRPQITEKALKEVKRSVYAFEVNTKSTKHQVKEMVEKLFSVTVSDVKTGIKKGKTRRVGRKMITKKLPDRKIAFVTVSSGKIDIFPQT